MRWIALILLVGAGLAVAGSACSKDNSSGGTKAPTATATLQEPEATNTQSPEPTDTAPPASADTPVPPVTYDIAMREDVSFGATVRVVYRVSVSGPLTEAELRRVAQEIIDNETSQRDVNAIGFFFYLAGTDTTSVYTAGKADWAPNGDWASADTVRAGDYSSNKLGDVDLGGP